MIDIFRDDPWLAWLVAFMVELILLVVGLAVRESMACSARGGEMVGTGEYYWTTTMSGKVPITTMHEHQECFVPVPQEMP